MDEEDRIKKVNYYTSKKGRRAYIKKKSSPAYIVSGIISDVLSDGILIISDQDEYDITFEDILSADIKGDKSKWAAGK